MYWHQNHGIIVKMWENPSRKLVKLHGQCQKSNCITFIILKDYILQYMIIQDNRLMWHKYMYKNTLNVFQVAFSMYIQLYNYMVFVTILLKPALQRLASSASTIAVWRVKTTQADLRNLPSNWAIFSQSLTSPKTVLNWGWLTQVTNQRVTLG